MESPVFTNQYDTLNAPRSTAPCCALCPVFTVPNEGDLCSACADLEDVE